MREAVIVSTARTPLAKSHRGEFNVTPGAQLAAYSIRAAVERASIEPELLEDVILGCGYPEGTTGRNIGRQAALRAGLPTSVGGTPNFSSTSGSSIRWFFIVFSISIRPPAWGPTSCIRSLSDDTMVTSQPRSQAARA